MSFSQYAGTSIMPTLSRIVLCVAFISVGYNKLFTTSTFNAEQATKLKSLGIEVQAIDPEPEIEPAAQVMTVSFQDVQTGDLLDEQPNEEESTDDTPGDILPDDSEVEPEPEPIEQLPPGKYEAGSMYWISLKMDEAKLPYPLWGARIAALTEFAGGILLLFGFLSRIWGLGLAFAMGVAFYIVTMGDNNVCSMWPWTFAENIGAFNTMYSQLGLGLLALGIFLTGPGPLSIDCILFGGGRKTPPPSSSTKDS